MEPSSTQATNQHANTEGSLLALLSLVPIRERHQWTPADDIADASSGIVNGVSQSGLAFRAEDNAIISVRANSLPGMTAGQAAFVVPRNAASCRGVVTLVL
ncbi:uncharacterized protein VTP21DRAFT_5938 [Calcarisporiella thermophila]|uniref:uncharacterized protein n=1 Tax=Calcarisporiella thermophila TaxID=911321 RepID=UPI0037442733